MARSSRIEFEIPVGTLDRKSIREALKVIAKGVGATNKYHLTRGSQPSAAQALVAIAQHPEAVIEAINRAKAIEGAVAAAIKGEKHD